MYYKVKQNFTLEKNSNFKKVVKEKDLKMKKIILCLAYIFFSVQFVFSSDDKVIKFNDVKEWFANNVKNQKKERAPAFSSQTVPIKNTNATCCSSSTLPDKNYEMAMLWTDAFTKYCVIVLI